MKWKIWMYDVWGNEEDGWFINDYWYIGQVELPTNPTDADVIKALAAVVLAFDDTSKYIVEWSSDTLCEIYWNE